MIYIVWRQKNVYSFMLCSVVYFVLSNHTLYDKILCHLDDALVLRQGTDPGSKVAWRQHKQTWRRVNITQNEVILNKRRTSQNKTRSSYLKEVVGIVSGRLWQGKRVCDIKKMISLLNSDPFSNCLLWVRQCCSSAMLKPRFGMLGRLQNAVRSVWQQAFDPAFECERSEEEETLLTLESHQISVENWRHSQLISMNQLLIIT